MTLAEAAFERTRFHGAYRLPLQAGGGASMRLGDVYNGVVWTETALDFCRQSSFFKEFLGRSQSRAEIQIVLAPGARNSREILEYFGDYTSSTVVLALDTESAAEGWEGFPKYCAQTLEMGIKQIHAVAASKSTNASLGSLGALVPKSDLPLGEAQQLRPQDEAGVVWLAVETGDFIFIGPALPHLAELILVHYGVNPERTLWICSVPSDESTQSSVDLRVAWRSNKEEKIRPVHVGKTQLTPSLPSWLVDPPIDLAGKDTLDQMKVLSSALFAKPIRLHHDCQLLRSKKIFLRLSKIRPLGEANKQNGLAIVRRWCHTEMESAGQGWFASAYERLPGDGFLFDHKNGAISFDSYEWENEIKLIKDEPWKKVVKYFEGTLGGRWQTDRPNLARRLETPTKTILRGEEYYINMANLPPLDRLRQITDYFSELFRICDLGTLLKRWATLREWKLALALCDQFRNLVLQMNWFSYQVGRHPLTKSACPASELTLAVRDLTDAAVGLYYSILLLDRDHAPQHLETLNENNTKTVELVRASVEAIRKIGEQKNDMTFTHDFVRRWREADHPGENLLTAAQAIDLCEQRRIENPLALGISWGGIELPLVFKHAWMITKRRSPCPSAIVADYSHYRKDGPQRKLPYNALVTGSPDEPPPGSRVIIFDDNVLTGHTIERVHDDLLSRGCEVPAMFVTRISGGRRYGQMRMEEHGVLNPNLIGTLVFGFLGETPFALTWSRKQYRNPIGIFSLSRRRILELLHANSSVERYDREGF